MRTPLNRRQFLKQTTVIGTSLATMRNGASLRAGGGANNKIVVAVMGTNGRGMDHIQSYLAQSNVEVGCICDVDSRAIDKGVAAVVKKQEKKPRGVKDFREVLEDKSVDVLSVAAPNHWHAPPASTLMWRNLAVTIRAKAKVSASIFMVTRATSSSRQRLQDL